MAIANITESSTFRAWYLVTNEIINNLNTNVLMGGEDVYGHYKLRSAANTSFNVANNLFVNASVITLGANTTFGANVVANSSVRTFTIGANTLVIAPVSGTRIDTTCFANANVTVNATLSVNGTTSITGALTIDGNPTITGNVTANGTLGTRQLVYTAGGAVVANTVAGGTYHNWAPDGIANCSILNITPAANIVLSGIAAPTNLGASGARILYVQNLSGTYSINLHSANASSDAANRFKTPGDANVVITPGSALPLIYVAGVNQWRLLAAPSTSGSSGNVSFDADVTVTGNLQIHGAVTGNTNCAFGTTLYVDKVTQRVGIGKNNPAHQLELTANAYIGNQLIAPTVNATTIVYGPTGSFGGGVVVANATGLTTTGYVSGNGGTSFLRTLTGNTVTIANTISTANLSVSGHSTFVTGAFTGNVTFVSNAVVFSTMGNTVTFANTITVNGTTNSYINTLRVNSLISDAGLGTPSVNTGTIGVTGLSEVANVTFTGTVKPSGISARFVLPVGTNYYVTA